MIDKLQSLIVTHNELSDSLSDPHIISNPKKFAKIAKEHNALTEIVEKAKIYIDVSSQLESAEEMLDSDDDELILLAKEEVSTLKDQIVNLETELKKAND